MRTKQFSYITTYSIFAVFIIMLTGVGYVTYHTKVSVAEAVKESEKKQVSTVAVPLTTAKEEFSEVIMMQIGSTTVKASVADSWPDRIRGLSGTILLPEDVVKLFVFDSSGLHSIWMKDMNYSIDIIWLDENGKIVHIVEEASPESYPAMFVPKASAKYVIETVAGFVKKNQITKSSIVTLPKI